MNVKDKDLLYRAECFKVNFLLKLGDNRKKFNFRNKMVPRALLVVWYREFCTVGPLILFVACI